MRAMTRSQHAHKHCMLPAGGRSAAQQRLWRKPPIPKRTHNELHALVGNGRHDDARDAGAKGPVHDVLQGLARRRCKRIMHDWRCALPLVRMPCAAVRHMPQDSKTSLYAAQKIVLTEAQM